MSDLVMSQDVLQSLIVETETLGWDNPTHLEVHDGNSTAQEGFAFIGELFVFEASKFISCLYHFVFCVEFCNTSY